MIYTHSTLVLSVCESDERRVLTENGPVIERSPMVELTVVATDDRGWGPTLPAALRHLAGVIEARERDEQRKDVGT